MSAPEEQVCYSRMVSDWLAIFPNLPICARSDAPTQLKLPWNHRLGEVTFADEIRHHVNLPNPFRIKQEERVAQTRFLFPECALHLNKKVSAPNLRRMRQRRRARIRVHRRPMANDEERRVRFHNRQFQRSTSNVQRSTLKCR